MDGVNFLDDFNLSDIDDVTITQLDQLPTQELVVIPLNYETKRFEMVTPASDEHLAQRKLERLPKNTRRQNSWAMGTYQDWARWRNTQADTLLGNVGAVPGDLSTKPVACIDFWMCRFIVECRRKDGSPYPPNTLYNIAASIERTLREEYSRYDISMFDSSDSGFAEFRKQLDSRMKELTCQGVGIHRQRADPVTQEDEGRLWDTGVIGKANAKALSYGIFFYNCKVFGFRGGDEHRQLQASQYRFAEEHGTKVLTFFGRNSKNVQGGLKQRKVEPKIIKQHANPNSDRCIVLLFDLYLKHVPGEDFYVKPLPAKPDKPMFFSSQKIGMNTLAKYMKSMYTDAGISMENRNIRNHSGKVTLCTRLYDEQFDEQAIMSRSGHRSVAVRDYKRPSAELLRNISSALQPTPSRKASSTPTPPHQDEEIKPKCTSPAIAQDSPGIQALPHDVKSEASSGEHTIEIVVPDNITTVIVNRNGRKVSVTL